MSNPNISSNNGARSANISSNSRRRPKTFWLGVISGWLYAHIVAAAVGGVVWFLHLYTDLYA